MAQFITDNQAVAQEDTAIEQADAIKELSRAFRSARPAAHKLKREQHIFFSRQRWDQVIRLKDETNLAAAQQRETILIEPGDVFTIEENLARGRRIQARE